MIVGLKGVIESLESNSLHLDVSGVVYEVFTPLKELEDLTIGESIKLHTEYIVREDSQQLYGFSDRTSLSIFRELLKVNGVGAKVGLAILSTLSIEELLYAIESGDEKSLVKVPKIGVKSAKRLINELQGLRDKFQIETSSKDVSEKSIAIQALEQLGFNRQDILKSVEIVKAENHKDIIREALKMLTK